MIAWVSRIGKAPPWRLLIQTAFFGGITWLIVAMLVRLLTETPNAEATSAGFRMMMGLFFVGLFLSAVMTAVSLYQAGLAAKANSPAADK